MKKAEIIYNRLFTRYFSPSDKAFNSGNVIDYMDDIEHSKNARILYIEMLLQKGYRVRGGYTTTGVRGYYDRILIYK